MHPRYPRIFTPIALGPVVIPNRFYFAPHGVAFSLGTKPSPDFGAYSAERAKGGCGLVVNSLPVHQRTVGRATPFPKENVPDFRAMADEVHTAGAKIFGEIFYWWGSNGYWQPGAPTAPSLAPSVVHYEYRGLTQSSHEMRPDEISYLTAAFEQSAANLREAGYDGVMLHAGHGAIIEQFTSPYFNRRTDDYGGSLERRLRFATECLEAARRGAGDAMAVGARLNCNELLPGGYDGEEAKVIIAYLTSRGLVDFLDLDVAIEPQQLPLGMPPVFIKPHPYRSYIEAVHEAAGETPIMSVLGRLTSIADAEEALASGVCDMVGAARALIAEPELVKNAFEGNEEQSRTCIACNWCMAVRLEGAQGCAINPASYRERAWGLGTLTAAAQSKKVTVIGAGPSGLEAARVSAMRGHDVTLVEARDELGGGLALWARLPDREWFCRAVEWWERELDRHGVDVIRGLEATEPWVLKQKPDAVIIATGARYSVRGHSPFLDRDIPGYERDFVYCPESILLDGIRPSGTVILLDGEGLNTSMGVAEVLAAAGAAVHYVMAGFSPISAALAENNDGRFVIERAKSHGVKFWPTTYIRSIGDHEVTLYDVFTQQDKVLHDVSAIVLSTGRESVNDLLPRLEGKVAQLFASGDALAARSFGTAAYEGQMFARFIGEPGAPRNVAEAYFTTAYGR